MFSIAHPDQHDCATELARINRNWKRVRQQYVELVEFWCSTQDRLELDNTQLSFDNASLTLTGVVLGKPFRINIEPTASPYGRCIIDGGYADNPKPIGTFLLDRDGSAYNDEGERIIDAGTFTSPHWVLLCNVLLAVIG
ncbi:hypothetical protein [Stutzerimonas balearica]|uniref:hypothetical protein n=1 Tax=Stutzerimonas balearica TaxID=74829 RepID=UPI001D901B46|nr:hypothetical protein [Stutzerimonas balearica]MBV2207746.1 hypothetical protein [Pseudomonas sp.]